MMWPESVITLLFLIGTIVVELIKYRRQQSEYKHAENDEKRRRLRPNNLTCPLCEDTIFAEGDDQRELHCGHRCHSRCYLSRSPQGLRCTFCRSDHETSDEDEASEKMEFDTLKKVSIQEQNPEKKKL